MSTPVWQAESKKDHEFVRRKAGLAPLRFYIYIQLNFCLGVKSRKSNCTFVGQGALLLPYDATISSCIYSGTTLKARSLRRTNWIFVAVRR